MQINSSAMMAMSNWMNNSANNVANVNTEKYNATQTTITEQNSAIVAQSSKTTQGTDLATEFTDQISIDKSMKANATTIKTEDEMIGSLLNMKA